MATDATTRRPLGTVREVAEFLSVTRQTIYSMMDRGDLPYITLCNNRRRIRWDAVDEMLADRTRGGDTDG